ncbi:Zinc finger, C3HC4 type (RING finger) [Seminavis robusta]|uniref:Zinc finger, C3HC4 type (RING finger) n=1 Tax=Seminavis robusta TaxID=568900 RepID=A0A9N8H7D7_9STRA|nr:Zinc finger, C3HC4 type (RING finger) [Seminavis robusta]|eukprot:Sro66_g037130.1 Zinc finger, C3HC4 type (RING finger) (429) ;mRNA; r:54706-55992
MNARRLVTCLYASTLFLSPGSIVAQPYEDPSEGTAMLDFVQCRLDAVESRTRNVQYSSFTDSYVEVSPIYDFIGGPFDDDYINDNPIVPVKICWCAHYFNRNDAYCPLDFNACRVEGAHGPVICFNELEGGSFVRGFFFICVFWFVALVYAFFCSDQGNAARAFIMRKLCYRILGHSNERDLLRRHIESMIQRDPERATWVLRSAFLRQQNRQRARSNFMTWWNGRNQRAEQDAGRRTNDNDNNDTEPSEWQQRMELKVKKYMGSERTTSANTDSNRGDASEDDIEADESQSVTLSLAEASQFLSSALSLNLDGGETVDNAVNCAICLCPLHIGDRVCDIPCGHLYCVECLKDWLKRKNHCPLCNRGGLATPIKTTTATSEEEDTTSLPDDTDQQDVEGGDVSGHGSTEASSSNAGLIVSLPDGPPEN